MFHRAAIIALALAAPAAADEVLMAERLGLEPGRYSVVELVTIRNEDPGPDRARRVGIIDRQHEAFARAVRSAMTGPASTAPTRGE